MPGFIQQFRYDPEWATMGYDENEIVALLVDLTIGKDSSNPA